jgi:hypothetical protein
MLPLENAARSNINDVNGRKEFIMPVFNAIKILKIFLLCIDNGSVYQIFFIILQVFGKI